MVHIHNEILLSHKKTNLSPGEVEEQKSEVRKRTTNIVINAYIWNLEKWY